MEELNKAFDFDKKNIETSDEETEKNLTFTIDDEIYGVKIENITQIIGIQHITYIPNQPEYVKGVINLRGQVIPVMEVRTKFKKPAIEYDDRTCIIVVNKEDMLVGLIVDRVSEVINIKKSDTSPTPDFNEKVKIEYIRGIAHPEGKVVILIDVDKLLNTEEENIAV